MVRNEESGRRGHRILRTALVLIAVVVLGAGGYAGYVVVHAGRPVTLPAPTGSYPVGRTGFEWTDATRTDPLAPAPAGRRELAVSLWYPAAPAGRARPADYTPGAWAQLHLPGPVGLAETDFADVHDHALADAPVAPGQFPVVILEPGLGFAAPQYTTLAEDLASHGYLVAGVTPTYSANLTVLHGRLVHATAAGNPSSFNGPDLHAGAAQADGDRLVAVWATDARFAADKTIALDSTRLFAGHVEHDLVSYVGHSFDGAASLEACRTDTRCAGAVDLDGTPYGAVVHTGLAKPHLLLASGDLCLAATCPSAPADPAVHELLATGGPAWCYQIDGARHFDFSEYDAYYLAAPLRAQLALGDLDGTEVLTITGAYVTAFLDHTVHARAEPLLQTGNTELPQVKTQRHPA